LANITYRIGVEGLNYQEMKDRLIEDDFDNGRTLQQYKISFENTHTVCIAYDDDHIIGTVRALSDSVCNAYIVDVWTYTPYRNQGIARRMMELTFERLQGQHIFLFTDSAQGLYERMGMDKYTSDSYQKVIGDWLQNDTRD
jgi:ribosomal protein S18 acetylase RimI-like enzyme